jgi:mxaC protein
LTGLLLVLLPLFNNGMSASPTPWLTLIPGDTLSVFIVCCLRLCAMAAIAGLVLGIAGLHRTEQRRERIGHGAHIVLLLDRSSSMDNSFAGRAPNGSEESKATAARRLLTDFVKQRQTDLIGVAEYSTAPLFVMPLTENKNAVQAAIAATATPALGFTHVSKGLGMALSFFQQQPVTGSRIVLLVSDGAAAIDHDSEQKLREWFRQQQVRLYWIFLRTANSPGIFDKPEDSRDDNAQAMPELYQHQFFLGLGSPYQAYEAESPDALKQAIADINGLENLPMHYFERIPKQDLSAACYNVATLLLLALLGVKFCEVKR